MPANLTSRENISGLKHDYLGTKNVVKQSLLNKVSQAQGKDDSLPTPEDGFSIAKDPIITDVNWKQRLWLAKKKEKQNTFFTHFCTELFKTWNSKLNYTLNADLAVLGGLWRPQHTFITYKQREQTDRLINDRHHSQRHNHKPVLQHPWICKHQNNSLKSWSSFMITWPRLEDLFPCLSIQCKLTIDVLFNNNCPFSPTA